MVVIKLNKTDRLESTFLMSTEIGLDEASLLANGSTGLRGSEGTVRRDLAPTYVL
jgi:hypothetical protein